MRSRDPPRRQKYVVGADAAEIYADKDLWMQRREASANRRKAELLNHKISAARDARDDAAREAQERRPLDERRKEHELAREVRARERTQLEQAAEVREHTFNPDERTDACAKTEQQHEERDLEAERKRRQAAHEQRVRDSEERKLKMRADAVNRAYAVEEEAKRRQEARHKEQHSKRELVRRGERRTSRLAKQGARELQMAEEVENGARERERVRNEKLEADRRMRAQWDTIDQEERARVDKLREATKRKDAEERRQEELFLADAAALQKERVRLEELIVIEEQKEAARELQYLADCKEKARKEQEARNAQEELRIRQEIKALEAAVQREREQHEREEQAKRELLERLAREEAEHAAEVAKLEAKRDRKLLANSHRREITAMRGIKTAVPAETSLPENQKSALESRSRQVSVVGGSNPETEQAEQEEEEALESAAVRAARAALAVDLAVEESTKQAMGKLTADKNERIERLRNQVEALEQDHETRRDDSEQERRRAAEELVEKELVVSVFATEERYEAEPPESLADLQARVRQRVKRAPPRVTRPERKQAGAGCPRTLIRLLDHVTSIDIDYRLSPGTRDDRSDSLVNYQRPKPRHWQRC